MKSFREVLSAKILVPVFLLAIITSAYCYHYQRLLQRDYQIMKGYMASYAANPKAFQGKLDQLKTKNYKKLAKQIKYASFLSGEH